MKEPERILLEHGGGGLLSHKLVTECFLPLLRNPLLERLDDGAVFPLGTQKICFSTDSYVVDPIFFPGGDIGSLAVHGTINDISVCGGHPMAMSVAFIIEEGFLLSDLKNISRSLAGAASTAGVPIVTGDTKVVAKGNADGIFITTSGIGTIDYPQELSIEQIRKDDAVIVSGPIGDHGAAILSVRRELGITSPIVSDSAPLNGLIGDILTASPHVHFMRDPTRGGLGTILAEIALQSHHVIEIAEKNVPVRPEVLGLCEMLGLDPLFLACEGRVVLFCPPAEVENILQVMRRHALGHNAAVIGTVTGKGQGRLIQHSSFGGAREIDLPIGELVPRIC